MNILFISFDADPPYMGGTSTVVHVLAKELKKRGHNISLGYFNKSDHPSVFFEKKIYLSNMNNEKISSFAKYNNIQIIYNTQAINTDWMLLKKFFPTAKIVSAYHNRPQLNYFPLYSLMNFYYNSNNVFFKIYTLLKIPLLPIRKIQSQYQQRKKFKEMERYSDKIMLLSPNFYPCIKKILPQINNYFLAAIPNPLVFDNPLPEQEITLKKKKVLVVVSSNYQKRTPVIIKIWKEIEKDSDLNDWSFDFVGEGEDYHRILSLSKKLNLKRITFHGYKNTEEAEVYYKEASIFLMTSRWEGWPMVLMEAMQKGVVPIVYNSFESVTDIINNNEDGFIIHNNDFDGFISKLKLIMKDEQLRVKMGLNAIKSSSRFDIQSIGDKYIDLFKDLLNS